MWHSRWTPSIPALHRNGMDYKFVLHFGFSGYLCIDMQRAHSCMCISSAENTNNIIFSICESYINMDIFEDGFFRSYYSTLGTSFCRTGSALFFFEKRKWLGTVFSLIGSYISNWTAWNTARMWLSTAFWKESRPNATEIDSQHIHRERKSTV